MGTRPFSAYNTHVLNTDNSRFLERKMSSGFHNRNKKDRRDSPSSSNRPRSNSKASSENQRNRTPPKNNINGKMPSVANSPATNNDPLVDAMASLALDSLKYVVGSRVLVKMNNGLSIKGEIIAYEPNHKIVMIKSPGTRSGLNKVELINLTHCVDITVEEEAQTAPGEMPGLNTNKLDVRFRESVEKKMKLITAFKAGVSPEGQRLFQTINKTLDELSWDGEKIVVFKEITIDPPYRPENIRGKDNKALKYVRNIVEKFFSDQEAAKGGTPSTATSSMSSSATSVDNAPTTASKSPSITTTIPNLPQAPAPPSKSGGGSNRSNRNNPGGGDRGGGGGRNKHGGGGGGHDGHHSKSMYSN